MKKIPSLFKRDYNGNGLVYNEIVEGSVWVVEGVGIATIKIDGTCCLIENGNLFKRYDRKLTKRWRSEKKRNPQYVPNISHYKSAPDGWVAAEESPNQHTGHWPGWLPVDFDAPENKWHKEAWETFCANWNEHNCFTEADGTYELIGTKIQANPYKITEHILARHGQRFYDRHPPRDYDGLNKWFSKNELEGIVWHHPDGRMVKIKRTDFGYAWPES